MSTDDVVKLLDAAKGVALLHQQAQYEVDMLRAIKDWAIKSLKLTYREGDEVLITSWRPHDAASRRNSGWSHYAECLLPGALVGVAGEITFSRTDQRWMVPVTFANTWSTHDSRPHGFVRYWNGPLDQMPKGYVKGSEDSPTVFYMNVDWVDGVDAAKDQYANTLSEAAEKLREMLNR